MWFCQLDFLFPTFCLHTLLLSLCSIAGNGAAVGAVLIVLAWEWRLCGVHGLTGWPLTWILNLWGTRPYGKCFPTFDFFFSPPWTRPTKWSLPYCGIAWYRVAYNLSNLVAILGENVYLRMLLNSWCLKSCPWTAADTLNIIVHLAKKKKKKYLWLQTNFTEIFLT